MEIIAAGCNFLAGFFTGLVVCVSLVFWFLDAFARQFLEAVNDHAEADSLENETCATSSER